MTHKDIRLAYHRSTGRYAILPTDCEDVDQDDASDMMEYITWLEECLIKHRRIKEQFLPWEPLDFKTINNT